MEKNWIRFILISTKTIREIIEAMDGYSTHWNPNL